MIENLSAYFLARFRDLPQLGRRRTIDATGIRVVASRDTLKGSNQFFFKIEFVSFRFRQAVVFSLVAVQTSSAHLCMQ
jgi:hypothetical protein